MTANRIVIVGASLAGAKAAEELRKQGYGGEVLLIGAEQELPYERPPLSKEYLRGESKRADAQVHPAAFYTDNSIELRLGVTVTEIDPSQASVTLEGGELLLFDNLLICTGASARRLRVPGAELDGIHYLRTFADCDSLRDRFASGGHLAVIGGGWIGSEVAADARQQGLEVTMIADEELPNARVFGREIGEFYRDVHRDHGVNLVLGDGAVGFAGEGAVSGVHTRSGRIVECDFVVAGVGAVVNAGLAQAAGIEVDDGILVDALLRSSAPNVFAAGDVANAWHPFYEQRIRLEHWANALNQGPAAARAMLGGEEPYELLPYFYSDQYDVGMEYSGRPGPGAEVVFRGSREGGEFVAFWLDDGLVTAGMNVSVWDVNDHVQALIRSRKRVDKGALSDPDTPLESLLG
jgi:3-phenylpropionate/trans-cinnamate dioxygenase ferredoxin reductase subunit